MRKIVPEIWHDDFILDMSIPERLLWIGLIVTCADDQGRLENNPRGIRIRVFPESEMTNDQITTAIKKFSEAGKLLLYSASDKELIQIKNWWKYQAAANYMAASVLPAPDGWEDHYHYNGKNRQFVTSPNWDKRDPLSPYGDKDGDKDGVYVNINDNDKDNDKGVISASYVNKGSQAKSANGRPNYNSNPSQATQSPGQIGRGFFLPVFYSGMFVSWGYGIRSRDRSFRFHSRDCVRSGLHCAHLRYRPRPGADRPVGQVAMTQAEFLALQGVLWSAFWPLPYIFLLIVLVGGIFLALGHVALNAVKNLLERF